MFTWICPQCGKEVPPHENECPYCHGTGEVEEPVVPTLAPPPVSAPSPPPPREPAEPAPPPRYAAPEPTPPQSPPAPEQQAYYEIGDHHRGMPGWLVTILVAAVVTGIGALLYFFVLPSKGNRAATQQESPFEAVPEGGQPSAVAARLSRHIEVTGFRLTEDAGRRAQCQFLVVNHSAADIGDLAGKVQLRTTEAGPDEDPIAEFEFKTPKLGPYESVEFKTAVDTKLRAYELPDWQYLKATVEITSPQEP